MEPPARAELQAKEANMETAAKETLTQAPAQETMDSSSFQSPEGLPLQDVADGLRASTTTPPWVAWDLWDDDDMPPLIEKKVKKYQ